MQEPTPGGQPGLRQLPTRLSGKAFSEEMMVAHHSESSRACPIRGLGFLLALLILWPTIGITQSLTWVQSRSAAIERAQSESKLIVLFAGRPNCLECQYMESAVAESVDPAVAALIQYGFIPWVCDIDASDEWVPYAAGLGAFSLPMICILSVTNTATWLDRSTGIETPPVFYTRLLNQVQIHATRPNIARILARNGVATIQADSLPFGTTVCLEKSSDPEKPNAWVSVTNFVSFTQTAILVEGITNSSSRVFYRLRCTQ